MDCGVLCSNLQINKNIFMAKSWKCDNSIWIVQFRSSLCCGLCWPWSEWGCPLCNANLEATNISQSYFGWVALSFLYINLFTMIVSMKIRMSVEHVLSGGTVGCKSIDSKNPKLMQKKASCMGSPETAYAGSLSKTESAGGTHQIRQYLWRE